MNIFKEIGKTINILTIIACTWYSAAIDTRGIESIPHRTIIEAPAPPWRSHPPLIGNPAIYKLISQENELYLSYLDYYPHNLADNEIGNPILWNTIIVKYGVWKYKESLQKFTILVNEDQGGNIPSFQYGDPNHIQMAKESLNGVQLENVYTGESFPYYEGVALFLPLLSYNKKYIGGFVWNAGNIAVLKSIGIWNANNGKIIAYSPVVFRISDESPGEIEIRFSPSDRFLIARYAENHEATDHITERHYEHLCYLLNTNTFELWPAHGDVAFTSDERWLVTGRDGMPTLVDAETGADLQRYDIGEKNIMTAACFSPDDRQLYIAGIDRKIYVFDSHLPSHAAGWEVYP